MTKTERDAARYRWLREKSVTYPYSVHVPAVFRCDNDFNTFGAALDGRDLDRAIDAAMKLEPAKAGTKAAAPSYKCAAGCGYPVAGPEMLCGECACEDDCAPD